jgi:heme A synthase
MARTLKIIIAIATLLTTLAMLGVTIYGLTIPHWGLVISCFALTILLGFFVRNDYYYFFQKKDDSTKVSK